MKAWRFHGFNDMRLEEVPPPACRPGHVLAEPLCVQPSVTEAQLAQGIPTLAFDRIKRRLETEAPVQLFGHEFCARVVEVGPGVTRFRPGDRVAARAKLPVPSPCQAAVRLLSTGLASFRPGAELPYHRHAFSEVIAVLSGEVDVLAEGRRYHLRPFDAQAIEAVRSGGKVIGVSWFGGPLE